MKASKRIFALMLALVMVFSTCVTAFAADDGSITISNATVDKEYAIYKVFDLTYASPVSYAPDGSATTPVAYTYTDKGNSDPFLAALKGTDSPFVLTESTVAGVYNVTLKSGKAAADVSKFLTDNNTLLTQQGSTVKATSTTVTFNNLPYGYYYITSTLGTVITLDSTLNNVTVIDKNQEPTWDNGDDDENPGKVIVEGTAKLTASEAKFGETVKFDIGVNATNAAKDKFVDYYFLKDVIGTGFDYVDTDANGIPDDLKVTVAGTEITNYTVKTITEDGKAGFQLVIPWATVTPDTEDSTKVKTVTPIYNDAATHELHVTYSAVLNDTAVIAGDGNKNTANFTYSTIKPGEPTPPVTPPTDPPTGNPYKEDNERTTTTYTYALGITKVDGESKAKLAGATFSLNTRTGSAEPYTYTKVAAIAIEGKPGYYKLPDGDPAAPTTTTSFVTNADGVLVIEGLDETTYYFIEEDAPDGYNLLTEAVPVQAQLIEETTYTTSYETYFDKDGNKITKAQYDELMGLVTPTTPDSDKPKELKRTYEVNTKEVVVENNKGVELPSTGGMGTGIFYLLGAVLLAGGAVLLGTKKHIGADR